MGNWEENLRNARINILRDSDASGMCLYETAEEAGIELEKLRQFVAGADSLTFGELQRVCEAMEFPFWALHVPEVSMDTRYNDPETIDVEKRIMAL